MYSERRGGEPSEQERIQAGRTVDRQPRTVGGSVRASETNPHKLIAVKSSHLTRRGPGWRSNSRQELKYLLPRWVWMQRWVQNRFHEKKRKDVVSFDSNNSHSCGDGPPSSSALPQWQLSHAVSRSQLTETGGQPTKRPLANQSRRSTWGY